MDEVSAFLDPIEMVAFAGSSSVTYAVTSLSADIEEALVLDFPEYETCNPDRCWVIPHTWPERDDSYPDSRSRYKRRFLWQGDFWSAVLKLTWTLDVGSYPGSCGAVHS